MTEITSCSNESFPYLSICSLCVGVVAQCIIFTAPLPFIAFMVVDFGASKTLDSAGYSAGWIAGIYMIGRISSGVAVGIMSDRWGRKPCLVISMINVAVLGILFGLSTNYSMALVTRLLCGVGNGFMSVCQTVVSELVHNKDHETRAYGYVNGAFGLGYIIGPAIGGLLARPALQYPNVISKSSLWGHYPYLLPCLVCSLIAALAAFLIQLNVPETMAALPGPESEKTDLEQKGETVEIEMTVTTACNTSHDKKQYGSLPTCEDSDVTVINGATNDGNKNVSNNSSSSKISVGEILSDSRLCLIILMNFCFCCFSVMIEEVFPLWCVSSVSVGGLAWSSSQVGIVLFCTGIGLVTFQVFFYGPVMAHFSQYSSETIFFFQNIAGGIPIILMPLGQYAVTQYLAGSDYTTGSAYWVVFTLIVVFYSIHSFIIGMVYATIAMVVNSSVPSAKRGTMNGMTGTAASLGNFFAPVIGANLFALLDSWSLSDGSTSVDGRVVFVLCGFLLMALGYMVKIKLVPADVAATEEVK